MSPRSHGNSNFEREFLVESSDFDGTATINGIEFNAHELGIELPLPSTTPQQTIACHQTHARRWRNQKSVATGTRASRPAPPQARSRVSLGSGRTLSQLSRPLKNVNLSSLAIAPIAHLNKPNKRLEHTVEEACSVTDTQFGIESLLHHFQAALQKLRHE